MSPTTAFLCTSEPFLYTSPLIVTPHSKLFFALSHAHPAFDWKRAISTPATVTPTRYPPRTLLPPMNPTRIGVTIVITPGRIISLTAACVDIVTHLS